MVQFNFGERTIKAKVVYYGPAQSGKTTNLEQIHRITDPAGSNRLISLNTAQDRTLFFDLLPFSLGAVAGYDFKVQLYTVPGQVQYNATRRVVLAGADAVVFVADSRKSMFKENLSAFENMKVNLLANRLVPEKVPLVLQYNKQDLPDLQSEAELNRALNPWGRRSFASVAAQGRSVIETFVAVVQEMLAAIALKYNLKEKGLDAAAVPAIVAEAFADVLKQAAAVPPPQPGEDPPRPGAKVVVSQATDSQSAASLQAGSDAGLVSEELLHRAIKSNVELAEALAGVIREMNVGLRAIQSHAELLSVYREDAKEKRQAAVAAIQAEAGRLRRIAQDLGLAGASVSERAASSNPVPPRPPARPAPPPMPAAARAAGGAAATAGPPPVPSPVPPPPPAAAGGFDTFLREALGAARGALDARGLSVQLHVPPGTALPRCPSQPLRGALADLIEGVAAGAPARSALSLRCERKPVLLRTRDGEVRRDFLMLAVAPGAVLSPEAQQRVVQGNDPGPMGQAARSIREMGGFVRFAPLPGGGLETRVFLPAA